VTSLRITPGSAYSAFCRELQKAEFERDLIRERTSPGRQAAKKRGVRFGRPPKLNSDQILLVQRLVLEGKSVQEILGMSDDRAWL